MSSNNMSRQRKNLFFWIMLIIVAFGLVTLTWGLWSKGSLSTVEFIGWITGAVLPALGFLYHLVKKHSLRFFLFTNRVRSIFSTHTLTWNLYANIQSQNVNEDVMNQVISKLVRFRNGATTTKIQQVNPFESIVFINAGPTLHISYTPQSHTIEVDEIENSPYVKVSIQNYRVGYRQATRVIQDEIIPVLETITNAIHAIAAKYTLTIEFDKEQNPFFGLYVANLPVEAVSNFYIRLNVNPYEPNDTVAISESKVSINTVSQNTLQKLALEFLTFDTSLQERLKSV